MAFQTPPTFVDGNVLSANQLNILAENQNYLSGLATGVNLGFPQANLASQDSQAYHVVHQHDNLYVYAYLPNDDTKIQVYYDGPGTEGNELVYEHVGATGGETLAENVDLAGFAWLVVGGEYEVTVACRDDGGTAGTIALYYIAESADAL